MKIMKLIDYYKALHIFNAVLDDVNNKMTKIALSRKTN